MLSGASEKCGSIYKFLRPFDNVHSLLCKMVWKVWRKLFSLVGFNCQMIGCPNRRGWEKFMWGGGIFDTAFQGWFCTFTFAMFYCIVSMTWVRCTSTKTVRSIWSEGGGGGHSPKGEGMVCKFWTAHCPIWLWNPYHCLQCKSSVYSCADMKVWWWWQALSGLSKFWKHYNHPAQ